MADKKQKVDDQAEVDGKVVEQVMDGVTPGAVLDAMEDPDSFAAIARGDLYVQMAHMRRASRHPEFSNTMRLEYGKFLAKMGKVDAPDKAANLFDSLPGINIVFPGQGTSVQIGVSPPRVEKEVNLAPDEENDFDFSDSEIKPSEAILP